MLRAPTLKPWSSIFQSKFNNDDWEFFPGGDESNQAVGKEIKWGKKGSWEGEEKREEGKRSGKKGREEGRREGTKEKGKGRGKKGKGMKREGKGEGRQGGKKGKGIGKRKELKLKNGRAGKEIKLMATLYNPALMFPKTMSLIFKSPRRV